ncbi:MAG: hypothetical protein OHK0032_02740 [Thermodesulfovibrionales bacterium]
MGDGKGEIESIEKTGDAEFVVTGRLAIYTAMDLAGWIENKTEV